MLQRSLPLHRCACSVLLYTNYAVITRDATSALPAVGIVRLPKPYVRYYVLTYKLVREPRVEHTGDVMGVTCDPECAEWAKAFDDCVCTDKVRVVRTA